MHSNLIDKSGEYVTRPHTSNSSKTKHLVQSGHRKTSSAEFGMDIAGEFGGGTQQFNKNAHRMQSPFMQSS